MDPNRVVSAQVMVAAAKRPDLDADLITEENVADLSPHPVDVEEAVRGFEVIGFEIGTEVGGTFAITGPVDLFERVFEAQLSDGPSDTVMARQMEGVVDHVLPVGSLPAGLATLVSVVTFSPPMDFGPMGFF